MADHDRATPRRPRLRAFVVLMLASSLASLAILPYLAGVTGQDLSVIPLPVLVLGSLIQNLIVVGPLTALGLWLGPRTGLGAPDVAALVGGDPGGRRRIRRALPLAVGSGLAVGVVILALAATVMPFPQTENMPATGPSWWAGLLAAYAAGVNEELQMRLGLVTLLAWVASRILRRAGNTPGIAWGSITVAALAFGALHLPLAATLAPLTPALVARTLVLNGIGGMLFGWLFWRRGLVAAMVAHFSADIVLHVLPPASVAIFGGS